MKECEFMSEKFNQLIELFIAEEENKAKELFHEIVVEKSREIYEGLIDEEDLEDIQTEKEEVDETDAVAELDDGALGGDAADDFINDIEKDENGLALETDEDDEDLEDRVVDLEDALDELKAEFDKIMDGGDEEEMDMDMDMDAEPEMGDDEMDMDMEMPVDDEEEELEIESVDPALVREYDEKVTAPSNSEGGVGTAGPVAKAPKAPQKGKAHPMGNSADEKGKPAPKAKDMGSTTEPNETKVSVPKASA
jgi:hypothetical protein